MLKEEIEMEENKETQSNLEKLITDGGSKSQNFWALRKKVLRKQNTE